jgi:hypothetical protein
MPYALLVPNDFITVREVKGLWFTMLRIWDVDARSSRIPDPDFKPSKIPDLGSQITILKIILFLKWLRKKFVSIFKEL